MNTMLGLFGVALMLTPSVTTMLEMGSGQDEGDFMHYLAKQPFERLMFWHGCIISGIAIVTMALSQATWLKGAA